MTDLIDREWALQELESLIDWRKKGINKAWEAGVIKAMHVIDEMPSETIHGAKWEYVPAFKGAPWGHYECSECGYRSWTVKHKFCPDCLNCGARMVQDD